MGGDGVRGSIHTKNERRLALIDKKYHGGGLDEAETAELARLKAEVYEYMRVHHPRDPVPLQEFEAWVAAMKAKVEAKRAKAKN